MTINDITFFFTFKLSREELKNLELVPINEKNYDDDALHSITDCTEAYEDDFDIAYCECCTTKYVIATTCGKRNVYLFEYEYKMGKGFEVVNATNITEEFDDLKTYESMIGYLQRLQYNLSC